MKLAVLSGFLAIISLGVCVAQDPPPLPLQPLDRPVIAGEKRCLPFFVAVKYSEASEEQLIFAYKTSDGKTKSDSVPNSRVVVQLVDGAPTYEKTITADGRIGARFKMSQADYEKAQPCVHKQIITINPVP